MAIMGSESSAASALTQKHLPPGEGKLNECVIWLKYKLMKMSELKILAPQWIADLTVQNIMGMFFNFIITISITKLLLSFI